MRLLISLHFGQPVYFLNDFDRFRIIIFLSPTNQPAKSKGLITSMAFLTFQWCLVFLFDILYFKCAHRWIGVSISTGKSALKGI